MDLDPTARQRRVRAKLRAGSKPTLAMIAEYVGVSRTTVSNAYNNPSNLSKETRDRIFEAAARLGYPGPDPTARNLRTRNAHAIGVVFTDKITYAFDDRASLDFLAGLAQSCQDLECSLMLIPVAPRLDTDGRASGSGSRATQPSSTPATTERMIPDARMTRTPATSTPSTSTPATAERTASTRTNTDAPAAVPTAASGASDAEDDFSFGSIYSSFDSETYIESLDLVNRPGVSLISHAAVDGFVVYSVGAGDPAVAAVAARNVPTVIVDQPTLPQSSGEVAVERGTVEDEFQTVALQRASFVGIDDHQAIQPSIEALVEAGHRKIGVLCIRLDRVQGTGIVDPQRLEHGRMHVQRSRVKGILDVITAAHGADVAASVPIVECFINDHEGTREAARRLLTDHPELTAVACTTDSLALAVLDVASELGLSVPEDLSVTGFDGIDEARHRGIVTVMQPNREKGIQAGQELRRLIDNWLNILDEFADEGPRYTFLETELVDGQTVAPPRG